MTLGYPIGHQPTHHPWVSDAISHPISVGYLMGSAQPLLLDIQLHASQPIILGYPMLSAMPLVLGIRYSWLTHYSWISNRTPANPSSLGIRWDQPTH
jgi:hypothetical protein